MCTLTTEDPGITKGNRLSFREHPEIMPRNTPSYDRGPRYHRKTAYTSKYVFVCDRGSSNHIKMYTVLRQSILKSRMQRRFVQTDNPELIADFAMAQKSQFLLRMRSSISMICHMLGAVFLYVSLFVLGSVYII